MADQPNLNVIHAKLSFKLKQEQTEQISILWSDYILNKLKSTILFLFYVKNMQCIRNKFVIPYSYIHF